jgi:hypothetical protein
MLCLLLMAKVQPTTAGLQNPKTGETENVRKKRAEHLVQHQPTDTFYARLKIKGKTIRKSLETDAFTTAKPRLPDTLNKINTPKADVGAFDYGMTRCV